MYIYIYRERERQIDRQIDRYTHTYTYTYIYIYTYIRMFGFEFEPGSRPGPPRRELRNLYKVYTLYYVLLVQ